MIKLAVYMLTAVSFTLFSCDDKKMLSKQSVKKSYSLCLEYPEQKLIYNVSSFSDSLILTSTNNQKEVRFRIRENDNGLFLIDDKWNVKCAYSFSRLNKIISHKIDMFPFLRNDSKLIKVHTIPLGGKSYSVFEYEVDNRNPYIIMENSFYLKNWGFITIHTQEPDNAVIRACNIKDSDIDPLHVKLVTDSINKVVFSRFTKINYTNSSVVNEQ